MSHHTLLDKKQTVLVIVDVQEAFRSAIPDFSLIAARTSLAVRGFRILEVPIIITEQYPKGLGRTAEEVLYSLPQEFEFIEKTAFSSCGASPFMERLKEAGVSQVVLGGIEAHICVNQTAHDLLSEAFQVHLLTDCIGSRFERDKQTAIAKMTQNGVIPSGVEMALFELMRDAKHEQFKEVQNLIK